jgi:hypothetical protein
MSSTDPQREGLLFETALDLIVWRNLRPRHCDEIGAIFGEYWKHLEKSSFSQLDLPVGLMPCPTADL